MAMQRGELTDKVLEALKDFGPMTAREISIEIDCEIGTVSMVLTRCRRSDVRAAQGRTKRLKRVHIHSWTYGLVVDRAGTTITPRMVFALGDKRDAKKPPPMTNAQRCRKKRVADLRRVNSIFSVGARDMNTINNDHT